MDASESKAISKVPLLGDIQILGELFKYNSKHKDKRELIILVTPYLVTDDQLSQARMSDSMKDFYYKGRQEKESLNKVDVQETEEEEEVEIQEDEEPQDEESFIEKYLDRDILPNPNK